MLLCAFLHSNKSIKSTAYTAKIGILKFSLMYLINNVHDAASSNLFIDRLDEATGFRGSGSDLSVKKITLK